MHATTTALVALLCGMSLAYPGENSRGRIVSGDSVQLTADECTEISESLPSWNIYDIDLQIYNYDNGGTTGNFGFRSYNLATNKTVKCMVENVDLATLDDGPWSICDTAGTEFRFNFTNISRAILTIKETWTCLGSPGLVFNANATAGLMVHGCIDNDSEKGVETDCYVMDQAMVGNVASPTDVHVP